jgi:DsbC/DsbD-like thiol-disulfide interchange protein
LNRLCGITNVMKRFLLTVFALIASRLVAPAAAETVVASPWLDFREAKVRLLAVQPTTGKPVVAGLEIRLSEGFKTYWRTAGDSGVPPVFDFSKSTGLEAIEVAFPFPMIFDDGAGGKAWGYKQAVVLPITAKHTGGAALFALKLDFAVCGTMCIPLSGNLTLEPSNANPVPAAEAEALAKANGLIPVAVAAEAAAQPVIQRLKAGAAQWSVRLPFTGNVAAFCAFPEAKGFLEASEFSASGDGFIRFTISGQAAPGAGGQFGPVLLTYGAPGAAYERMIDLDGAPVAP